MKTETSPSEKTSGASSYKSIQQRIVEMKTATANAQLPPVIDHLLTVGYSEESLKTLHNDVIEVENLDLKQQKEYREQYLETSKFDTKRAEIKEFYLKNSGLCRILFRNDINAQIKLNLAGRQKEAYAPWLKDVKSFYSQLLNSPELIAESATIGITKAIIDERNAEIAELESLKDSQKKETAEAQVATDERDKAFDRVHSQYYDMLAYAKLLMGADQALEALGIVVKR